MGQPGPRRWLGVGIRFLATLFFLLVLVVLARCGRSALPMPATPTVADSIAYLTVEVGPAGSRVYLDGQLVGTTPLSLEGPAGQHILRVEADGYQPLEGMLSLTAGDTATVPGELVSLSPSVTSAAGPGQATNPPQPILTATAEAGGPSPTLPPQKPPPTPTSPPAAPPTKTPPPPATDGAKPSPSPPAAVTMHEGQVTIPTYPYASFTAQARNETFNVPYAVLDRAAYDASNPAPKDTTYRSLVVENEYLRLTFLPDLGGRLYEVVYKPTGHRETYRNPVLKPSPWGPPEQGWWLAAGGIEWCLPVAEHGYEWGMPWQLQARREGNGVTVSLRDTEAGDRVRVEIAVRLEAGASSFTIRPRLENPTSTAVSVKYWTNAMLAPGGRNAPSADLRFVLPIAVTAVTVHSGGDEWLPNGGERLPWPVFNGVDLSRLGNWNRWLGFFEDPAVGEFTAVYDEQYDEGMICVFPVDVVRGVKGFAFGWKDPIPPGNWTDDRSSYVEVHSGPAPTFDDSVILPAGGHLQWTETWYPVAGLGGVRFANATAALNLAAGSGQARLAVAAVRPWSGDVVVLLDGQERWRQGISLLPGQPFRKTVPLGDNVPQVGRLALRLEAPGGVVAAVYSADFALK